jgi:hypothetical protein
VSGESSHLDDGNQSPSRGQIFKFHNLGTFKQIVEEKKK